MTKRERRSDDTFLQNAALLSRCGDFMANFPTPTPHANPVTPAIVREWFVNAFRTGAVPSEANVRNLVYWLNIAGPQDSDEITKRKIPEENRRLSEAIQTIIEIVPEMIQREEGRLLEFTGNGFEDRMQRTWHDRRARALRALRLAATFGAGDFTVRSKGGVKQRPAWKMIADSAASLIASAMLQAGHSSPNFDGGPALAVLQRAMAHVEGKERPVSQLREAFRTTKKSLGD